MPIGLFAPNDLNYQSELWQQISQNAPWLFDKVARAARVQRMGAPAQDWEQKMMAMISKRREGK